MPNKFFCTFLCRRYTHHEFKCLIDYFIVMGLVTQPLSERETEVELVWYNLLSFLIKIKLKKYSFAKEQHDLHNTEEGLHQNKVNSSLVSTCNPKMNYSRFLEGVNTRRFSNCLFFQSFRIKPKKNPPTFDKLNDKK